MTQQHKIVEGQFLGTSPLGTSPLREFVDHQADRTIFMGPRGSGRTMALVRWVQDDPEHRAILVRSQNEADRIETQYGVRALPWNTPAHLLRSRNLTYAMDGVEAYLYSELTVDVTVYSITGTDDTPPTDQAKIAREAIGHYAAENARLRRQVDALAKMAGITCDGRCLRGDDVGIPGNGIAYPDPECSLHGDTEAQLRALGIEEPEPTPVAEAQSSWPGVDALRPESMPMPSDEVPF